VIQPQLSNIRGTAEVLREPDQAPTEQAETTSDLPKVWAILEERAGDDNQVINLVAALGWPCEFKTPLFSMRDVVIHRITGRIAGPPGQADLFKPPWPDMVVTIGGRSSAAARWIKLQSKGRTKLICLGRPWAPLHWFDLVVTTPQYGLPHLPNVLQNTLPLNRLPAPADAASADRWISAIEHLPSPRIAVMVGGSNGNFRFDRSVAVDMASRVDALARETGGSLMITTSPRSDPDAGKALLESVRAPHIGFLWRPETKAQNPYSEFLQAADHIVVTGDSASMIAEACATRAKVSLYELPETLPTRLLNGLARLANGSDTYPDLHRPRPWIDRLIAAGCWVPRRAMNRLHQQVLSRGRVARLGEEPSETSDISDLDMTLRRVRQLILEHNKAARPAAH